MVEAVFGRIQEGRVAFAACVLRVHEDRRGLQTHLRVPNLLKVW
jgi:hypothetical protein